MTTRLGDFSSKGIELETDYNQEGLFVIKLTLLAEPSKSKALLLLLRESKMSWFPYNSFSTVVIFVL